jgi:hypothetical protein
MTKTNDVTDSGMRLEIDRLLNGTPLASLVTLEGDETTSEVLQYVKNELAYKKWRELEEARGRNQ